MLCIIIDIESQREELFPIFQKMRVQQRTGRVCRDLLDHHHRSKRHNAVYRQYPFKCIFQKDNRVFTFVYRPEDIKPVVWDVWKIKSTIV